MALTTTEEALVRQLLDQQAAILSLADAESTIISKLGATKVTLADLTAASSIDDADLFLIRQGTSEKSVSGSVLKALIPSVADASETVKGIIEIATDAEARAYTAGKAIDGAKLASAMTGGNQSLSTSGYQKLPGGLIIQWGDTTTSASSFFKAFPISFPNACFVVAGNVSGVSSATADAAEFQNQSTTGCDMIVVSSGSGAIAAPIRYVAIGY